MPKKLYPKGPPKQPKLLKFRFQATFTIPIEVRASNLEMARSKCIDMSKNRDFVDNLDVSNAQIQTKGMTKWEPEIAWVCCRCGEENWFRLSRESCFDYCNNCYTRQIIIDGFIGRTDGGCDKCEQRIECLSAERAKIVYVEATECL